MSSAISADNLNWFFGIGPWVLTIAVLVAAFFMARAGKSHVAPVGRTFACANCGRRGVREHMVPQPHEGAVVWYCSRCSGSH
jgi:hypothetical protein